jgi:acyl-CoA reductase-like NAD-dependent aldehyde dehydrogenase
LEPALARAVEALYGAEPKTSAEYGRIVNERHFDRLASLLAAGRVVTGGGSDRATKYIAPTVLADVALQGTSSPPWTAPPTATRPSGTSRYNAPRRTPLVS